jgi:hypothetical protein
MPRITKSSFPLTGSDGKSGNDKIDRQTEVPAVNETLARVEHMRKFTIMPKRLYEEDGEVTPTMKVKRKIYQRGLQGFDRSDVPIISLRSRCSKNRMYVQGLHRTGLLV